MTRRSILAAAGGLVVAACTPMTRRVGGGGSVQVSMEVILDTVCIPVTFLSGGRASTVRCWLDTGGGAGFVSPSLARQLGLRPTGTLPGDGPGDVPSYQKVERPILSVAGFRVDSSPVPWVVAPPLFFNRTDAEAMVPARVLAGYDLILDYPMATFTIGVPGALHFAGVPVDAPISSHKFPRVELEVDGQRLGMLVDTGASHTLISSALFDRWHARHPDWPVVAAALGTANMASPAADRGRNMMLVPAARLGGVEVAGLSVVTRPTGTFERIMSSMTSGPVVGSLAGNTLASFRVGVDYQHGQLWLSPPSAQPARQFVAPFNVEPDTAGYSVADSLTPDIATGDRLVQVGGRPADAMSFAQVVAALSSPTPGQLDLVVRRDGVNISRRVARIAT